MWNEVRNETEVSPSAEAYALLLVMNQDLAWYRAMGLHPRQRLVNLLKHEL
jgi:hypothetical protein